MATREARTHPWKRPRFWVLMFFVGYIPWLIGNMDIKIFRQYYYEKERPALLKALLVFEVFCANAPGMVLPFLEQSRLKIPRTLARMIGLPLVILALGLRYYAIKDIGKTVAGLESVEDRDLVTDGIHGFVRHPNYLGIVLLSASLAVTRRAALALLLSSVWLIALAYLIPWEEKELEEEFGARYHEYIRDVPWRIIPGVF